MILNEWKRDEVELILIKEMGAPFNILKDNDDIVGITTWINERYVRETSKKVRDALSDRMKAGILVQGPRYGYIKGEKGTLKVNEEVKEAIQTIFNLYEEGYGMMAIAKKLNIEYDYKNPSIVEAERFKKERGRNIKRNVREYWETDMINKILRDENLTGTLITHRKEVKGIHGKAKVLPKEENYRFEDHHEAIISKEQFARVQAIIQSKKENTGLYQKGKNYYVFSGFVKCGDCGASATGYIKNGKKHYECLNYSKYRTLRCTYHGVSEKYILENFKMFLKTLKNEYKELLKEINLVTLKKRTKSNKEKIKIKLDRAKQEYKVMQKQKIKEVFNANSEEEKEIIEESYAQIIAEKLNEITEMTNTLKYLENETEKNKKESLKKAIDYFDEIIKSEEPSKDVLIEVLDKILIYPNKNIEFKLKMSIDRLI